MVKLNIDSLEKAFVSFQAALAAATQEPENDLFRDATIQRFEFTFELAIKILRRQLSQIYIPDDIKALDYKELIRIAADINIIDEPRAWFIFREKRNITSHTYNEIKAQEVFDALEDFAERMKYFIAELERRNGELGA